MKQDLGNVIIKEMKPGKEEAAVNDKFWDLNKTKQNSMINGALKVFSRDGFRHASTDEIVAEAGISKGLLFHYFYSKSGIYEFLAEYSARFALVELNSGISKAGPLPYFELQRKITASECAVMRRYPYLFLFLERAGSGSACENPEDILSDTALYNEKRSEVLTGSVLPDSLSAEDAAKISRLLDLARKDTALRILENGSFDPERFGSEINDLIQFFEKIYS